MDNEINVAAGAEAMAAEAEASTEEFLPSGTVEPGITTTADDWDDSDIFSPENIPVGNWFKFEKVGDRVSGIVDDIYDKPSKDPAYPDQKVFVLKQKDGTLINVPVKKTSDYLMGRTNRVQLGDLLAFSFEKEIPPPKKGLSPAKSIQVFVKPTLANAAVGKGIS